MAKKTPSRKAARGGANNRPAAKTRPTKPRSAPRRRDTVDLFRLLVESVQDYAIILLDPKGHVASWNAGAERVRARMQSVREMVGQLTTASAEILASTSQQAAGAQQQAAAVSQTVSTVTEVAQTAEQGAQRARGVGEAVQRSRLVGEAGRK